MKKYKVIIDTDPGVDDSAALVLALFDEKLDIKLISTAKGNVDIDKATRNLLHLLDKFKIDIPVVKGLSVGLSGKSRTAEFMHGKEGMGGYNPPHKTFHKVLPVDAIDKMYEVIKQNKHEISILVYSPHTNIGALIQKYPDVTKMIKQIIFMGGSPYGVKGFPDHISFNISSDVKAFKIVLDSNIPLIMIPSDMGRRKAHLDEQTVYKIKDANEVGNFLFQMYKKYWELGFPDKRIATNDTCAYLFLTNRKLFKTKKADIYLDMDKDKGKTIVDFNKNGKVRVAVGINREKFLDLYMKKINEFKNFKFK